MRITDTHAYFWGGMFSNWYPSQFQVDGEVYNCAEQYMMHQKALIFKDKVQEGIIMGTNSPATQKAAGRKVKNFDPVAWREVCEDIMVPALIAKFTSTEVLQDFILLSGNRVLVEASPYDKIWGVGLGENDPRILDEANWDGENLLGKVLMRARDEIRKFEEKIDVTR